jgi:imidazolonepropionase-like amidohydrolase
MKPFEAIETATVEPARYFGRTDIGVLKPGSVANIIIIGRNPLKDILALRDVHAVVLHGRNMRVGLIAPQSALIPDHSERTAE